jgi:PKD repeat protein
MALAACTDDTDDQVYIGFSYTTGPNFAPCTIEFYNYSVNADDFLWDFGDGTTSTEPEPVHYFENAGNYPVTLTASNANDSKTTSRTLSLGEEIPVVTAPPDSLGLDPFYTRYIDAKGIPVISSDKVPDEALIMVRNMANYMLKDIPEVRDIMIGYHARIGIMSEDEVTTDIPEHAFLAADTVTNWDERARGLGGTVDVPITTCAEENILCYAVDKYSTEDIFIHEFAHAIHLMGLRFFNPGFDAELTNLYNQAIAEGKWANTYAATNYEEYWAEGIQDWFNCNTQSDPPNGVHNHVNTRGELMNYDAGLYNLINTYFTDDDAQISCHEY